MTSTQRWIPYRSAAHIERVAQRLLGQYAREIEPITEPTVPIEDLLERHLRLDLAFGDLREWMGVEGVLGALCVDRREVLIDQSLDPEEHPELEGRYRFTLAHEIGHWQLHRDLYHQLPKKEETPLAAWDPLEHRRLERQADLFAACILMPRPFVFGLWREVFQGRLIARSRLRADLRAFFTAGDGSPTTLCDEDVSDPLLVEREIAPLADEFRVSPTAMRIRMEQLGLVVS